MKTRFPNSWTLQVVVLTMKMTLLAMTLGYLKLMDLPTKKARLVN